LTGCVWSVTLDQAKGGSCFFFNPIPSRPSPCL
jgi:hypothetical protein